MRVKILNVKLARAWQRWEIFLDVKKSKVKDHKRLLRFITAGLCPSLNQACGRLDENMSRGSKGKTWKVRKESDHSVRSKTRARNKTSCAIMASASDWTTFSFDLFDRICEKRKTNGGDILRQITSKRLTICHGEVFSLVQQHLIREQILPGYNRAPELNNELQIPNKVEGNNNFYAQPWWKWSTSSRYS